MSHYTELMKAAGKTAQPLKTKPQKKKPAKQQTPKKAKKG